MCAERRTRQLKTLILAPDILALPVTPDPLCARLAARAGFRAVFAGGYSLSATYLGAPDIGLMTMTEVADCVARIADAVDVPVFADADTGYGGTRNVSRTVRQFEKAGAAALFIEDQQSPKRCGHLAGKTVVPTALMVDRIRAALDARSDPDLMVMARTDALAVEGLEATIARAQAYCEAGADLLFVDALESEAQMERVVAAVPAPQMVNMLPGGRTPVVPAARLQQIGFAMVSYATVAVCASARAVEQAFAHLVQTGTAAGLEDQMMAFDALNALLGLDAGAR